MQYGEKTTTLPTENGWYYLSMDGDPSSGPILQLEDGSWFDEDGEEVTQVWDSTVQAYGTPNGAEFWIRQ